MHKNAEEFYCKARANAREAGTEDYLYMSLRNEDGSVTFGDNYECFGNFVYTCKPDGSWLVRMYGGKDKPVSNEVVQSDATILFTG